jgi:hypothetical protein
MGDAQAQPCKKTESANCTKNTQNKVKISQWKFEHGDIGEKTGGDFEANAGWGEDEGGETFSMTREAGCEEMPCLAALCHCLPL